MSQSLSERYYDIRSRLSAHPAQLVAVSKGQDISKVIELYRLGHRDFGENYVQELLSKVDALAQQGITDIRWHFLGHLQTNKVKQLLPHLHLIHSVDSMKLAQELSKRALGSGKKVSVLLEINIDSESTKSGLAPDELEEVVKPIAELPGVRLQGLMCIPAQETGLSGDAFRRLRALRDEHRGLLGPGELSMGMSEDFEVAAREGSSWVRVGTALFGPRKP